MQRLPTTTHSTRRAFTLVEMLLMLLIVALLIGLLTVGLRHAIAVARRAASTQDVNSLKIGVESFRNDFGFTPPLVKDGYPQTPGNPAGPLREINNRTYAWTYNSGLSTQLERDQDREYLIADPGSIPDVGEDDYRFSTYSLAYYLMGALGKDIDGLQGPGSRKPLRDGSFDRMTTDTYPARYDPKGGSELVYSPWSPGDTSQSEGRWQIRDRNGVAFRYYRWEAAGPNDSGYSNTEPLANLRVPKIFGDAALDSDRNVSPAQDQPEFRDAGYALVAAGADGVFGDYSKANGGSKGLESFEQLLDGIGKRLPEDPEGIARAENAARADNIVETGK